MRYALITGAYGGMGYATTKLLSSIGYTVFALDKKIGEALENVIPIELDVTDVESVKTAFDQNGIEIPFNQLDVHVKNK